MYTFYTCFCLTLALRVADLDLDQGDIYKQRFWTLIPFQQFHNHQDAWTYGVEKSKKVNCVKICYSTEELRVPSTVIDLKEFPWVV